MRVSAIVIMIEFGTYRVDIIYTIRVISEIYIERSACEGDIYAIKIKNEIS